MKEILAAPAPYGLLKDADGLITTVSAVNSALLTGRRKQASDKIDGHYATVTKEIATIQGDAALRVACLKPLELLKQQVERQESLAHVAQAEAEAIKEFDAAIARIEEFVKKAAEKPARKGTGASPASGGQEAANHQGIGLDEGDLPGNARRRDRLLGSSASGASEGIGKQ